MTVESNNVIAIATRSAWLKPTNEKQNQNQSHHARVIFPAFERVTGGC